jgi:hypothetical protein
MAEATEIETEIATQSELYRPVAKRASLLYFVIADLGNIIVLDSFVSVVIVTLRIFKWLTSSVSLKLCNLT